MPKSISAEGCAPRMLQTLPDRERLEPAAVNHHDGTILDRDPTSPLPGLESSIDVAASATGHQAEIGLGDDRSDAGQRASAMCGDCAELVGKPQQSLGDSRGKRLQSQISAQVDVRLV